MFYKLVEYAGYMINKYALDDWHYNVHYKSIISSTGLKITESGKVIIIRFLYCHGYSNAIAAI